jgi:hypothetical protein
MVCIMVVVCDVAHVATPPITIMLLVIVPHHYVNVMIFIYHALQKRVAHHHQVFNIICSTLLLMSYSLNDRILLSPTTPRLNHRYVNTASFAAHLCNPILIPSNFHRFDIVMTQM